METLYYKVCREISAFPHATNSKLTNPSRSIIDRKSPGAKNSSWITRLKAK